MRAKQNCKVGMNDFDNLLYEHKFICFVFYDFFLFFFLNQFTLN
jgi:hypothetical protein